MRMATFQSCLLFLKILFRFLTSSINEKCKRQEVQLCLVFIWIINNWNYVSEKVLFIFFIFILFRFVYATYYSHSFVRQPWETIIFRVVLILKVLHFYISFINSTKNSYFYFFHMETKIKIKTMTSKNIQSINLKEITTNDLTI